MSVPELYNKINLIHSNILTKSPTNNSYGDLLQCVQRRIQESDDSLNNLINNYSDNKEKSISASEMNKNSETLYQKDLYYIYGKIFFFIILAGCFYYFFKLSGVLGPIKNIVDKVVNKVKDNVKNLKETKMPSIKLPEVTASIKLPDGSK